MSENWKITGESTGNYISVGSDKKTIARVSWGENDFKNAKLIAAAPELLEALKGMCEAFHKLEKKLPNGMAGRWSDKYIQQADNAIKKATE